MAGEGGWVGWVAEALKDAACAAVLLALDDTSLVVDLGAAVGRAGLVAGGAVGLWGGM